MDGIGIERMRDIGVTICLVELASGLCLREVVEQETE